LIVPSVVRAEEPETPVASGDRNQTQPSVTTDAEKKEAADKGGGAGDLMITTTRVVLDDKKRSTDVTLINRGTKEATYRVILKKMRMLEDGKYEDIDDKHPPQPGEAFADDVIRYSPRQVTLKPGESQLVKFAMKGVGNIAAGEYRSHVLFQGNPEESQGTNIEQQSSDNKKISVRLVPIYGISIPIIVRHGDLTATATLGGASVKDKKLQVTIARQGTKSLYGDFVVSYGNTVVGQMRGVAVFVPNEKRIVQFDLNPPEGESVSGKELTVIYREREEDGGKVLAETKVKG
jgi:hypothetical protein